MGRMGTGRRRSRSPTVHALDSLVPTLLSILPFAILRASPSASVLSCPPPGARGNSNLDSALRGPRLRRVSVARGPLMS